MDLKKEISQEEINAMAKQGGCSKVLQSKGNVIELVKGVKQKNVTFRVKKKKKKETGGR